MLDTAYQTEGRIIQKNSFPTKLIQLTLVPILLAGVFFSQLSCTSNKEKPKGTSREKIKNESNASTQFTVENSRAVVDEQLSQTKAEEIKNIKEDQTTKIVKHVQEYYDTAFFQPELWEKGKFSKLDSFFVSEIRNQVKEENFDSLCLGDDARKLDSLESLEARIPNLWIALDRELKPRLCALTTEAEGQFTMENGKTAHFKSNALLFLEPVDDGQWQIFDYDLKYELKSEEE